ncbi:hypothetical protein ABZ348_26825 [Streptomyces sp. NPDC005963]
MVWHLGIRMRDRLTVPVHASVRVVVRGVVRAVGWVAQIHGPAG